jgi:hypothetical protein
LGSFDPFFFGDIFVPEGLDLTEEVISIENSCEPKSKSTSPDLEAVIREKN